MTAATYKLTIKDGFHLLFVFLLLMGVYLWSMPASVVLEDDGYFSLAAWFNSVTHPPGYPLFTMLAHLFTWLPTGSVAYRVHMASAFFGALACVAFWYLAFHLFRQRLLAYIAALGLGVSATFWSQAVIAEVYTLNVLLFVLLAIVALHCLAVDPAKRRQLLFWFAFLYGLSLSNHWPLVLLSTPAFLVLCWPVRAEVLKNSAGMLLCMLCGLLPYAWLVWRSHAVPEYSFFGPIQSFSEFWFYVSRQHYAGTDFSVTAGWQDKLRFGLFALGETARQFGPAGAVLVVIGFIRQWLTGNTRLAWFMTFAWLGSTFLLILIRNTDFDYFHAVSFSVYPLVSYLVAMVWILYAVRYIVELADRHLSGFVNRNLTTRAFAALVILGSFLANAGDNYRRDDRLAEDYALTVLTSLEKDAVIYANADNIDGPIRYMHAVENVRPDVTMFTGRYMEFNNELYRPYELSNAELHTLINNFITHTEKPVYYTNDFPNDYPSYRYGFYKKVKKEGTIEDKDTIVIRPVFLEWLQQWGGQYQLNNAWDIMHYNLLLEDFCELLLNLEYSAENLNSALPDSSFFCSNYQGTLQRLESVFAHNEPVAPEKLRKLLERGSTLRANAFTRQESAKLDHYRGLYYLQIDDKQSAVASLEESIDTWPHPDNPSRQLLETINREP